jgi:hypothetical protein
MDVLNALYGLRDKSYSLTEDDRAFVLETIAVHEDGKRRLNRQEILGIVDLDAAARGVPSACAHQLQAPVLTADGDPTNVYECSLCHARFTLPDGPSADQL